MKSLRTVGRLRRWPWSAAVMGLYVPLALAVTYPLVLVSADRYPSRLTDDSLFMLSVLEWERFSLANAPKEFFAGNIFYGSGGALFGSHLLLALLPPYAALATILNNPVLAFNLAHILSYVLSASAMFWAIRAMTSSTPAAFLAGLIYAFGPLALHQSFHPNFTAAWWIPLALLFSTRLARSLSWRHAAMASLMVWLQFINDVHQGYLATIVFVIFGVIPAGLRTAKARSFQRFAAALAAILVVSVPFFPFVKGYADFSSAWGLKRELAEVQMYSAQISDYLVPSDRLRWFRGFTFVLPSATPEQKLFLGFSVMTLALLGTVAGLGSPDRKRGLREPTAAAIAACAAGLLLSLGPNWRWNGRPTGVELPYAFLYRNTPVFQSIRVAARYSLLVQFGVSVLAGVAIARLPLSGGRRTWAGALASGIVMAEAFPTPLATSRIPSHDQLQAALSIPPRGPVLFVPVSDQKISDLVWLNTSVGGGPMVHGYSGTQWPQSDWFRESINKLEAAELHDYVVALRRFGISRLVIQPLLLSEREKSIWADLERDPLVVSYQIAGQYAVATLLAGPAARPGRWSDLDWNLLLERVEPGKNFDLLVTYANRSSDPWLPPTDSRYRSIRVTWTDSTGARLSHAQDWLPPPMLPAGSGGLFRRPTQAPFKVGRYILELRLDTETALSVPVSVDAVDAHRFDGSPHGLDSSLRLISPASITVTTGAPFNLAVDALNRGSVIWDGSANIRLGIRWFLRTQDGEIEMPAIVSRIPYQQHLFGEIPPGAGYPFRGSVEAPDEPGEYIARASMLAELVAWFDEQPVELRVSVVRPP